MRHWVLLIAAVATTLSMTLMLMVSVASFGLSAQTTLPAETAMMAHHSGSMTTAAGHAAPAHAGHVSLDCSTLHSALPPSGLLCARLQPSVLPVASAFLAPPSLNVAPLFEPPRRAA